MKKEVARAALDPGLAKLLDRLASGKIDDAAWGRWKQDLAKHKKRRSLGEQLVAVVLELLREQQPDAARKVCELAFAALGDLRRLATSFERAGGDRALFAAVVPTGPITGPVAPKTLSLGVGLRRPTDPRLRKK